MSDRQPVELPDAEEWKRKAETASHNAKHYADMCVTLEGELEMSNDALGSARSVLIANGLPDLPFLCDGIQNAINTLRQPEREASIDQSEVYRLGLITIARWPITNPKENQDASCMQEIANNALSPSGEQRGRS